MDTAVPSCANVRPPEKGARSSDDEDVRRVSQAQVVVELAPEATPSLSDQSVDVALRIELATPSEVLALNLLLILTLLIAVAVTAYMEVSSQAAGTSWYLVDSGLPTFRDSLIAGCVCAGISGALWLLYVARGLQLWRASLRWDGRRLRAFGMRLAELSAVTLSLACWTVASDGGRMRRDCGSFNRTLVWTYAVRLTLTNTLLCLWVVSVRGMTLWRAAGAARRRSRLQALAGAAKRRLLECCWGCVPSCLCCWMSGGKEDKASWTFDIADVTATVYAVEKGGSRGLAKHSLDLYDDSWMDKPPTVGITLGWDCSMQSEAAPVSSVLIPVRAVSTGVRPEFASPPQQLLASTSSPAALAHVQHQEQHVAWPPSGPLSSSPSSPFSPVVKETAKDNYAANGDGRPSPFGARAFPSSTVSADLVPVVCMASTGGGDAAADDEVLFMDAPWWHYAAPFLWLWLPYQALVVACVVLMARTLLPADLGQGPADCLLHHMECRFPDSASSALVDAVMAGQVAYLAVYAWQLLRAAAYVRARSCVEHRELRRSLLAELRTRGLPLILLTANELLQTLHVPRVSLPDGSGTEACRFRLDVIMGVWPQQVVTMALVCTVAWLSIPVRAIPR